MSSSIWHDNNITLDDLQGLNKETMIDHLNINYTNIGERHLEGTMPVGPKTIQPAGVLHGGASCVLAETLGSVASNMIIDREQFIAVGQMITTQHLRPGLLGETVTGKAEIIHLGKKSHLWNIDIKNSDGKLISTTRLTMAIVSKVPRSQEC